MKKINIKRAEVVEIIWADVFKITLDRFMGTFAMAHYWITKSEKLFHRSNKIQLNGNNLI